jgi:gas vesicle protein
MGKKAGKIALGLGLLAGTVTGLLFAPEEGKKIRKKIAKGDTEGLLKDLQSMGHEIKDMAVEIANKPSVLEVVEKAKDKAADVADLKREELDELLVLANKKAEQFKQMAAKYVREQKAELDAKYKKATAKKKKTTKKKAVAKKAKPVEKAAPVKKAPAKKAAPKKPVAKKTPVKKVVAKKKAAPKNEEN